MRTILDLIVMTVYIIGGFNDSDVDYDYDEG